jgi:F0F1-type ATP synthase assembly protein I
MSDQYGDGPDLRVEPKAPDRSLGELFAEMATEMGDLVRTEIELAKTETKEEVTKAGKAGGMFAGAGLEAYFMLLFLSVALAYLLDAVMARPLAFLIVALLHGIVAYVLYSKGRAQMKQVQPIPQTVGSIKENT